MDTERTWDDGSVPYLVAAIVAAVAAVVGWLAYRGKFFGGKTGVLRKA